jgi:predicted PurR-regulated permease PerM
MDALTHALGLLAWAAAVIVLWAVYLAASVAVPLAIALAIGIAARWISRRRR